MVEVMLIAILLILALAGLAFQRMEQRVSRLEQMQRRSMSVDAVDDMPERSAALSGKGNGRHVV
jgi:hypothetical protein